MPWLRISWIFTMLFRGADRAPSVATPLRYGFQRSRCDKIDAMPPEKLHWKHLYSEVVTSGLCTGCSGCVIACPHDVLGYRDTDGVYRPFQIEDGYAPDNCSHGERGCTSCTRACPRFRAWEPEIDEFMFGRTRASDEPSGIYKDIMLTRASDPVHRRGRPGRRPRVGDPAVRAREGRDRRRAR